MLNISLFSELFVAFSFSFFQTEGKVSVCKYVSDSDQTFLSRKPYNYFSTQQRWEEAKVVSFLFHNICTFYRISLFIFALFTGSCHICTFYWISLSLFITASFTQIFLYFSYLHVLSRSFHICTFYWISLFIFAVF